MKIARWDLQHGEFFDLYDLAYQLGIPFYEASKVVMCYLRSLRHVDKEAESSRYKPEPNRAVARRNFIKMLAIHPEPAKAEALVQNDGYLLKSSA
ncbi:hypothetical protein [Aeromonas veronii]|uniref:hypothetical protein n=1 Tax=Aeromonas veronii TaxID=654 RepID=UPI001E63F0C8|nr:hypothetical protein [Aeromonas veronii]